MLVFNDIRLAVCIPCRETVYTEFSLCLNRLLKFNLKNGIETEIFYNTGTLLSHQREYAVLSSRKFNPTHILWLDSDMIFPEDTAYCLLSHEKDVVSVNYNTRRPPHHLVGMKGEIFDDRGEYTLKSHLEFDKNKPVSKELIEVDQIGLGCILINYEVFTTIPRPWFEIKKHPNSVHYYGEDANFCRLLRDHGYKILVDEVLSTKIKHIGIFAVNYDTTIDGDFNNKF